MQSVIITGAGIGIGQATARAFANAGYHVVLTDVLEKEGNATAEEIKGNGGSAEFHVLDVRSTEAVNAVVADVERRIGPLDVAVGNAGIAHRAPILEMTDEKWDHTHEIDLKGIFRLARAVGAGMKKRGSGNIVGISSMMGPIYGWDERTHYSAAKAGVTGLIRGLAVELGRYGIRANAIAPGYIRSAQTLSRENSIGPEGLDAVADIVPLQRAGMPDDIADVVLFLASQSARYITGQVIVVDGGLQVGRY
ncbi:MAG TPA: SDR family NAD(P)-dependent oxidoreductase [Pseudolabrys sp.]|nr:SDR family NAD(P)-dependent oxidoreductase [Pseudolabrys sp.]